MPQRTNDYQQLVTMIQRAFAPLGAKITESALVPGQDTLREIDILIESEIGPYSIKIAVEVKDHKRKLDVTHIETIIGKYQGTGGILIHKVVVIAQRGFTDAAERRAKQTNLELLTIAKAKHSGWLKSAPQTLVLRIQPHVCRIEFAPSVITNRHADLVQRGRLICKCCGKDKGTPAEVGNKFLRTQVLRNPELLQRLEQEARRRNGQSLMSVSWPMANHALRIDDETHDIEEVLIHVHCISASQTVNCTSYEVLQEGPSKHVVDHLDAQLGGKRIRAIIPDGPSSDRIVLRIDSADPQTPNSSQQDAPATSFTMKTLLWDEETPHKTTVS
jgi:hypothetical protein